jgi:quercetin dioxygenase-like cupin family protein
MNVLPFQTDLPIHNSERLLDGPLLIFDLPALMEKIEHENDWESGKRNAITLMKGNSMRLVLIALKPGAEIDFRQSDNLISLQLLKGRLEVNTENETVALEQGHLITLHENIQHGLVSESNAIFLLTIGNCSAH